MLKFRVRSAFLFSFFPFTGDSSSVTGVFNQAHKGGDMRLRALFVILVVVLVVPAVADAQNWILRARAISVDPNESSDQIGDSGSGVAVDSATTLELDLTYMFSKSLGLEVIAGTTGHDLTASGGDLNGADLGSVKVLPPTFTLQWYVIPEGFLNIYLGAGVNYTLFYNYDLSDTLASIGVTDIKFDSSFGLAANAGLNLNLSDTWMLNADVKYIQIGTEADIRTADGTLDKVKVDIDPWVIGLGVGVRF